MKSKVVEGLWFVEFDEVLAVGLLAFITRTLSPEVEVITT